MTTTPLPTDTYYRGYRLSKVWVTDHWVWRVYWGPNWVDTFLADTKAKADIDSWLDAK